MSTKTGNNQDFFNRWIDKGTMEKKKELWKSHLMKYYAAIKNNELLFHMTK